MFLIIHKPFDHICCRFDKELIFVDIIQTANHIDIYPKCILSYAVNMKIKLI
jgi:hypothetical protein